MNRGYCCIALNNPKTDVNVGSALRAVGVFDADILFVSGHRYHSSPTDTMKTVRHTPLVQVEDLHETIPFDCVPVAIEITDDAESLVDYVHPERAYYIFGAEDATLGKRILSWCRDVVKIPSKRCLNLAATVNVVLYDRMAKQKRKV